MRMYGKVFGGLIIVLIIIYNLPITGSAETVASSNNDPVSLMAMYGTLVQAVAAVVTLSAMVWLDIGQRKIAKEQKELTRRQVNIPLYERRYLLYRQVLEFYYYIKKVIKTPSDQVLLDELNKNINGFNGDSFERKFLLDDTTIKFIEEFRDDAKKLQVLLCETDKKDPKDSALLDLKNELSDKYNEETIYLIFKHILDFRNI